MQISPRHETARAYALAGIPVFPCRVGAKEPACYWQNERTCDLGQIDQWWAAADYNVGLVPEDAGWCVIDLDGQEGMDTWNGLCHLYSFKGIEPSRLIHTPSGGQHRYFLGSIPPSVGKLGAKIDTRGRNSYVLIPPSVVNGKPYVDMGGEIADLPAWIAERFVEHAKASATEDVEVDRADNVSRAREWLSRQPVPVEGQGSDEDTYRMAARLLDLGLGFETAAALLAEHTGFEWDWIIGKLENCEKYRQNDAGAFAASGAAQDAAMRYAAEHPEDSAEEAKPSRFAMRTAAEDVNMPPLEFWDDDRMLVKSPEGAVAILYGETGQHKTNVTLTMLFEAMEKRGARVVYATGEGGHGLGKQRVPAHAAHRGIELGALDDTWRRVPAVPMLPLPEDVNAFVAALQPFKPDIVVLDTLATATSGVDENSSMMGGFLNDNGPVGWIKRAFGCLVIILAHSGKDAERGVRGSSAQMGNVDTLLRVSANKAGGILVWCEKMRDAADKFAAHYKVSAAGVPVPVRISADEYRTLSATCEVDAQFHGAIAAHLRDAGAIDWAHGLGHAALMDKMQGPEPTDVAANQAYKMARADLSQKLRNATRDGVGWSKELGSKYVPPGGDAPVWRWHLPNPAPG